METPSWELAKQVFEDALEKVGSEQKSVVEAACGDDSELLSQVEALLKAHEEAGDFLSEVTVTPLAKGLPDSQTSNPAELIDTGERFRSLQTYLAGRYTFEGELGRGGMGVVYLARDVSLDRPVAVKLLATDLGGRIEARERFLREARTAARLSHPNIVPVHAVEEHGDILFFVMAFVEGETVRERVLRTGPLSVGDVSKMLQEVAWALDYAHGRGVVHRDVKPDNIILETGTGRSVVTDFGIARAGESAGLTSAGALLGTPEYVSPEQALGNELDGRSDVYSLGVTCFFALTGRLPFEADSVQGMLTKHVQEPPPSVALFRPDVPRKLVRAIDRCLAKDPKDRFGTAVGLAEAVAEARAQVAEVPAALREVRREAELLVLDGAGFGALSAMVGLGLFGPQEYFDLFGTYGYVAWGIRVTVWLLTIGLVGSRAIQVIRRSREAVIQGFSPRHLGRAFGDWGREPHRREGGHGATGLPVGLEASALLASLVLLAFGWAYGLGSASMFRGGLAGLAGLTVQLALVVLPVLVGRTLGGMVIRRWPATRRAWARLWEGRMGRLVFKVGGIGLGKNPQHIPAALPTEALVAGAAAALFNSLPTEYQARLEELPELIGRLESAADALRRREAELERALATVGTVGNAVDGRLGDDTAPPGSGDAESVRAHRARAAQDLDSARDLVKARLSATVTALENLRLGLLRLQAGVGSPDELTADLRAAREIGREVQALLEGERRVEGILGGDEPTNGPQPARNDPPEKGKGR